MKQIIMILLGIAVLSGCVSKPAVTPNLSLNRTIPERVTDLGIERQVLVNLDSIVGLTKNNHRVAIDAFRGDLLLTGEVPTEATKRAIEQMAKSIKEVKKVHNRLKVSDEPKSQSHTVHENYLKTKYLGKLMTSSSGIRMSQYRVVVRDDIIYMMGMLTVNQAQLASKVARQTEGIMGFVSLMTVLASSQEEISRIATHDSYADGQAGGQMSGTSLYSP